jgi:hypothetical protein
LFDLEMGGIEGGVKEDFDLDLEMGGIEGG